MKKKHILFTVLLCLTVVTSVIFSGCTEEKKAEKKEIAFKMKLSEATEVREGENPIDKLVADGYKLENIPKDYYFRDAIFIGDSRTQGLMMFSTMKNATFYADKGMSTVGAFKKAAIPKDGKLVTIADALKAGDYGKLYISLGINELGYPNPDKFIERYAELVDIAKKSNPKAKIFVQGILPVSANKSASGSTINNEKIMEYNNKLLAMARDKKVEYINVGESVADQTGALAQEGSWDGVHLNKEYCLKWEKYIMEHMV